MGNAQLIRDVLEKGMEVNLIVKTGTLVKRHTARVLEVKRAAARIVLLHSGREMTVRFNDIEIDSAKRMREEPEVRTPVLPVEKAQEIVTRGRRSGPPPLVLAPPLPPVPAPEPVVEVPQPQAKPHGALAGVTSSLDAWLSMGKELAAQVETAVQELDQQVDALKAEQSAILDELKGLEAERRRLVSTRETILSAKP